MWERSAAPLWTGLEIPQVRILSGPKTTKGGGFLNKLPPNESITKGFDIGAYGQDDTLKRQGGWDGGEKANACRRFTELVLIN